MDGAMTQATQKAIWMAVERSDESVKRLDNIVVKLGELLNPAMRLAEPRPGGDALKAVSVCEISDKISFLTNITNEKCEVLEDFANRLQI